MNTYQPIPAGVHMITSPTTDAQVRTARSRGARGRRKESEEARGKGCRFLALGAIALQLLQRYDGDSVQRRLGLPRL